MHVTLAEYEGVPVAQAGWLGWSKGRRPPGAVLYSSREPSELSQWHATMTAVTAL